MVVVTKLVVKETFCHVLMIINTKQTTKNFSENIFEQNVKTAALKTERQRTRAVADLHSKILDAPPPGGPNSFNFMQLWENLAKSYVGGPPGELAPPLRGNPGSATVEALLNILKH